MSRQKKTTMEKLKEKRKSFAPYTISVFSKHLKSEGAFSPCPMLVVKIKECPNFFMYITTWERNPSHFTHVTFGNIDIFNYKGTKIGQRIGKSVDFSTDMNMSSENWGEDVPDDVRFFIRDSIIKFITDMKVSDQGWSAATSRMGFPLKTIPKFIEMVNGVCMARVKVGRPIVKKIEEVIEETVDDEPLDLSDD